MQKRDRKKNYIWVIPVCTIFSAYLDHILENLKIKQRFVMGQFVMEQFVIGEVDVLYDALKYLP